MIVLIIRWDYTRIESKALPRETTVMSLEGAGGGGGLKAKHLHREFRV